RRVKRTRSSFSAACSGPTRSVRPAIRCSPCTRTYMPAVILSPSSSLASLACAPRIASFVGSAYQWQAAVGPAEWVSFLGVPSLDEALERCDQLIHRTEIAMAQHPSGDDLEPQLDLIEP